MELKLVHLTIDDELDVQGYVRGQNWNGFECPLFTKEQGDELVRQSNASDYLYPMRYDEARDVFIAIADGEDEEYGAIEIEGVKYYPIGSHVWVWSLAEGQIDPFETDETVLAWRVLSALGSRIFKALSQDHPLASEMFSAEDHEEDPEKLRDLIRRGLEALKDVEGISPELIADATALAEGRNPRG